MLEFSVISVSSYEANSLVDQLNAAAGDGWSVVSIVPTGSTVTAYLSREAGPSASPEAVAAAPEPVAPEPAPVTPEPVASAPAPVTPEPVASAPAPVAPTPVAPVPVAPEPAPQISPEPATQTQTVTSNETSTASAAATTSSAPAGWFADPSGRFEVRYWDGGQWTEHVARAGQQFTDPPVA